MAQYTSSGRHSYNETFKKLGGLQRVKFTQAVEEFYAKAQRLISSGDIETILVEGAYIEAPIIINKNQHE